MTCLWDSPWQESVASAACILSGETGLKGPGGFIYNAIVYHRWPRRKVEMLACRQLAWHWSLQVTPTLMHNYNQCPAGTLYQGIYISTLTPSLLQPVNFPDSSSPDAPANSRYSGSITYLLSVLCVLINIISHASAKKKAKGLKGFKFRTFIGRFQATQWQWMG